MSLSLFPLAWRPRALAALFALLAAAVTVAALSFAGAGSAPSLAGPGAGAVHAPASLADLARTAPDRSVEVVVQLDARVRWDRGPALLAAHGGVVTRDLHIIRGYGARMSARDAQALAADPAIRAVTLNAAVSPSSNGNDASGDAGGSQDGEHCGPSGWLATSTCAIRTSFLQSTRTDKLWGERDATGTGRGVAVALIDTGVAGGLPDFRTSATDPSSRVIASAVTNPDATTEDDTFGHGTHVAGLIAGNGSLRDAGDPLRGAYLGAAPNADLVSVKVSDDNGGTSVIDVIYGLQFAVDHRADYNIRVVNLSLTAVEPSSYRTDPLDAAVESAWMHGLVVVAAAGNNGSAAGAVDYAPGNDPYAITVGATDDQGTKRTADDVQADWSSRGVTGDGTTKPDVLAPGAHMVGPYAPGSRFGELCPSCVIDGQYFKVGGTSMSVAVVSGIVADLLELHPDWTPDQVKGALIHNMRPMADGRLAVDANHADSANRQDLRANEGLQPNTLIDPATGDIDYTRASWSRASWSQVLGSRASWSRASWSRASWSRASWSCDCEVAVTGDADPSRASWSETDWSRASWSRASWSRASWSRASWSASFSK